MGTFEGLGLWRPEDKAADFLAPQDIGLSGRRVMALGAFGDEVWAGTMVGGLNVIRNGQVKNIYRYRADLPDSISANAVSKIYEDSAGRRWVTTYGAGVNLYLGEGKFQRFPDMTRPDAAFSDLRTLDIVEIEPNRLGSPPTVAELLFLMRSPGEQMRFGMILLSRIPCRVTTS